MTDDFVVTPIPTPRKMGDQSGLENIPGAVSLPHPIPAPRVIVEPMEVPDLDSLELLFTDAQMQELQMSNVETGVLASTSSFSSLLSDERPEGPEVDQAILKLRAAMDEDRSKLASLEVEIARQATKIAEAKMELAKEEVLAAVDWKDATACSTRDEELMDLESLIEPNCGSKEEAEGDARRGLRGIGTSQMTEEDIFRKLQQDIQMAENINIVQRERLQKVAYKLQQKSKIQ